MILLGCYKILSSQKVFDYKIMAVFYFEGADSSKTGRFLGVQVVLSAASLYLVRVRLFLVD